MSSSRWLGSILGFSMRGARFAVLAGPILRFSEPHMIVDHCFGFRNEKLLLLIVKVKN